MSEKESMFLFIVGLLLTAGGAGGVEQSLTNLELAGSVLVAVLGLAVMYCGTLGFRNSVDK